MEIKKPNLQWNTTLRPIPRVTHLVQHHMQHPSWTFEQVHNFHRDGRGWGGIGYNYWIGFDGTIYEGRGKHIGAHAGSNWNPRSLGIGYQGDFTSQEMTNEQLISGAWLNAKFIKEYDLKLEAVIGHKDASSTTCPGPNFRMEELKELVGILVTPDIKIDATLDLDGHNLALLNINSRTYAPVRSILTLLGYNIQWDDTKKTVIARKK